MLLSADHFLGNVLVCDAFEAVLCGFGVPTPRHAGIIAMKRGAERLTIALG
jgi:hypothetical protein